MAGKRLLFFAEAVTLAHLARPLALIEKLSETDCEIHLACPTNNFRQFLKDFPYPVHDLDSITPAKFRRILDWGLPLFSKARLRQYIKTDLGLIEKIQPDVVIGDLRLSLAISARVAKIHYINITNAYWRPEFCPIPPLPCLRPFAYVPHQWVEPVYRRLIPSIFASHARPFNQLRRQYGLLELGDDVRKIYTNGDTVLYADVPEMYPDLPMPENHHFLGPLLWAPPVPEPPWWGEVPDDKPIIYVVAGTSGSAQAFQKVLDYMSNLPVTVIAALGHKQAGVTGNLFHAPWLDGLKSAQRADLMICNGGVMGCHQAAVAGIPVLGICANMDQFLNMRAAELFGIGRSLRQDEVSEGRLAVGLDKQKKGFLQITEINLSGNVLLEVIESKKTP